jgi:hypothetical protein
MPEYTYRNLLDFLLEAEENPEYSGNSEELWRHLLADYFFRDEAREKPIAAFFKGVNVPDSIRPSRSLVGLDPELVRSLVENEIPNETLCGKIMMSKPYLKTFYSNHQPEFKKMPPDVQMELLDEISVRNESILDAFHKMQEDITSDTKRTNKTLAALIIRNIHLKHGIPYNKLDESVDAILSEKIENGDAVFQGRPQDMASLGDDSTVKDLIKTFFPIKQHKDLVEYAELFKKELERYKRRTKPRG